MTFRQKLACDVSPVLLRLTIALTFGYLAMWGFQDGEFSGADAAALANAGVVTPVDAPSVEPVELPDEPGESAPQETDNTTDDAPSEASDGGVDVPTDTELTEQIEQVVPMGADADGSPQSDPLPGHDDPNETTSEDTDTGADTTSAMDTTQSEGAYSASDFETPVHRKRYNLVTARIYQSAHPNESGAQYLPGWAGRDRGPQMIGYVVYGLVVIGAAFLLIGFLTRLASLGLIIVMLGSLWITQIAPVALGDAPGMLGILPAHDSYSLDAWSGLLWQLLLLAGVFATFCSGSGWLSIDRFLMGTGKKSSAPKSTRVMPPLEDEGEKRPI
ncbi:MAG: DoxX family membrane protein [Phycisphaerales bacterium JB043]